MELILLALILTVFLALAPVRSRSSSTISVPPAVRRQVDLDELRNALPPPLLQEFCQDCAPTRRNLARRSVPTIEEDHVETITYQNKKVVAVARGELLVLRVDDN